MRSDFDWHVGILRNEVLYLCKYCILKGGWKIKSNIEGKNIWGDTIATPREMISPDLKDICIKLSKCVGDGLYGLDVKETHDGFKVIEINDNPSIYKGLEDAKDPDIYEKIIGRLFHNLLLKLRASRFTLILSLSECLSVGLEHFCNLMATYLP